MKPNWNKTQERKLLAAVREIDQLREIISHPTSIRLEKPIQRGWLRRYALTKEAQLRPDRKILEDILEVIGTTQFHWRRNFIPGRRTRRTLIEMKQPLREILVDHWNHSLDKYLSEWKPYFHLEYKQACYYRGHQWYYVFTPAHLFELKVLPHWMTHLKIIDPLAIERMAELETWMEHHSGWRKHGRLKGCSRLWQKSPLQHKLERQAKRELRLALSNPEEVETRARFLRFHFSFFSFSPPPRSPASRGAPLKMERLRVQLSPWGPFSL